MSHITDHDHLTRYRCPRLGGEIDFSYCRSAFRGLFCNRLIHCWIGKIPDLTDFLKEHFSEEQIVAALNYKENRLNIIRSYTLYQDGSDSQDDGS